MKVVLESRQILVACKISASFKTLPIRPRLQWRGMMRNGSQENTFEPEQIANCKYIDKQVTLESRDLLIRGCLISFFELSHQTLSWHDKSLMSGRNEFPLLFFPLLQTELNYKVLFFFSFTLGSWFIKTVFWEATRNRHSTQPGGWKLLHDFLMKSELLPSEPLQISR